MKDPGLRSVSYAARGLAIDMISLMHESDRRGYLQVNGKPATAEMIARMTGGSPDEVSHLLQELMDSGVFSCTDDAMYYSRRMVRDETKRRACSEAGVKGGGNPAFKGGDKGHNKGSPEDEGVVAEELPEIALAQKIAAAISWSENIQPIAGAIRFCVQQENKTKNEAVTFLMIEARRVIAQGGYPDRFWWTGRKWRTGVKPEIGRGYVPPKSPKKATS